MFHPIKKALKIGAGALLLTAATSAAVGYAMGKRRNGQNGGGLSYGYDDNDSDDDERGLNRKQAVKDMVQAGRIMKEAWGRIQRDAKVIAKETAKKTVSSMESDEDEEE